VQKDCTVGLQLCVVKENDKDLSLLPFSIKGSAAVKVNRNRGVTDKAVQANRLNGYNLQKHRKIR
jgi:hypothetical protein